MYYKWCTHKQLWYLGIEYKILKLIFDIIPFTFNLIQTNSFKQQGFFLTTLIGF